MSNHVLSNVIWDQAVHILLSFVMHAKVLLWVCMLTSGKSSDTSCCVKPLSIKFRSASTYDRPLARFLQSFIFPLATILNFNLNTKNPKNLNFYKQLLHVCEAWHREYIEKKFG